MKISEDIFGDIGIDSIGFYAPRNCLNLIDLAKHRNVDPNKYKKGLLLREMRFPDTGEDIVSMGLKAGYNALTRGRIDPTSIDAIFIGTETMTYAVKSVSNILAQMLGVSVNCMTQDVYNACAAGTLAILNAIALIEKDVINKALVISSDISTYRIGSPGEPTQGAGAAAMVISKNPRIATFSKKFGKISGNINDFYRLAHEETPEVFGEYSINSYLTFQLGAYDDLIKSIGDFYADYYTLHSPYSKLTLKCMQQIILRRWSIELNRLLKIDFRHLVRSVRKKIFNWFKEVRILPEFLYSKLKEGGLSLPQIDLVRNWVHDKFKNQIIPQLVVPMHFGNMYSASVWAQIFYILENSALRDEVIYFGSYGSGATCISGLLKVQPEFVQIVNLKPQVIDYFEMKQRKSVQEYEDLRNKIYQPKFSLGHIIEHEKNDKQGFTLHFCDEGCIIPKIEGLDYCPKGHSGYHSKFFPLFAILDSDPIKPDSQDIGYLKNDLVRINGTPEKGNPLEFEVRRVEDNQFDTDQVKGSLNWTPTYIPLNKTTYHYIDF